MNADAAADFCWEVISGGDAATQRLGELLGQNLPAGTVIALVGSLGAGKTRLTQGIATGLEVDPLEVNSPTFALVQEYAGRLPVAHFDTYRLRSVEEFLELGAEEYLAGDGVCVIEWADRVDRYLPAQTLRIHLGAVDEKTRRLRFQATDPETLVLVENVRLLWEAEEQMR